jgi:hypothetical protein
MTEHDLRTAEYPSDVNEMGEAPVLIHGTKKLSQSGVILLYLADRSGKFLTHGEDERLEALRWILFDNQKVGGYLGPYRFLYFITKPRGDQACTRIPQGPNQQFAWNSRQALIEQGLSPWHGADHRRRFPHQLSLLSAGGIRLRHRGRVQKHRRVARPHQGTARLGASLRLDAGPSAGTIIRRGNEPNWEVLAFSPNYCIQRAFGRNPTSARRSDPHLLTML